MKSCKVCPIFCLTTGVHPTTWDQLRSKYCRIRSKTVYHDVEQSETDQQDRFFATALGAGGLEFESPRPDQISETAPRSAPNAIFNPGPLRMGGIESGLGGHVSKVCGDEIG